MRRLMASLSVFWLVCSALVVPMRTARAEAQGPPPEALATLRAALADDVRTQPSGALSIVYADLVTGRTVALNATQVWDPASVVKLFAFVAAYHRRSEGRLDFNTRVIVDAANVVPTAGFEDGEYPGLYAGDTVTVGTLVAMMIRQSDNTAYNTLLDLLGPLTITAYARGLGLAHTTVARKLNLDGALLAEDIRRAGNVENSTTAHDVALLYRLLYQHKVALATAMLSLLKRQKQNTMLPAGLPRGAVMAHKPGEVGDTLRHDGGIVYLPGGGAFLLVVFSSLGSHAELADIAGQAARAYPGAPLGTPQRGQRPGPEPSALATLLRLTLVLVSVALLALVVGLDRGLVGQRPRRPR